jgi:predicted enzyme related to lactoylglutathione lyase
VPPHWSVNFRVADADAVAARVAELGGRVLLPPTDAAGFRSAVLLDPQNAVLSVSQVLAAD